MVQGFCGRKATVNQQQQHKYVSTENVYRLCIVLLKSAVFTKTKNKNKNLSFFKPFVSFVPVSERLQFVFV